MIKKFICGLTAVGSLAFSLLAANDVFVGTWKMNEAKTKATNMPEAKDMTLVITKEGDGTVAVSLTGKLDGQPLSQKWTQPIAGGPVTFTEGAPPAGVTVVSKMVGDRTVDTTATMNGKQISMQHTVVSADHKTMTVKESGMNEKGPYNFVAIYERQ